MLQDPIHAQLLISKVKPSAHQLTYVLNVIILYHSLVLQHITVRAAGSYSCSATNIEGETLSPPGS